MIYLYFKYIVEQYDVTKTSTGEGKTFSPVIIMKYCGFSRQRAQTNTWAIYSLSYKCILLSLSSFGVNRTVKGPANMTSYLSVMKGSRPGTWWLSSLCILIGFVWYWEKEYSYLSDGKFSDFTPTASSSLSPKLNEQIKTLQNKVDILQKRYMWLLIVLISSSSILTPRN